ncbi:MAG: alpha/beta fold hydrolase [Phycisphaerae bacterium]|nr:alpha/beta fold hydrolase [Phycisphaerae bacterium]
MNVRLAVVLLSLACAALGAVQSAPVADPVAEPMAASVPTAAAATGVWQGYVESEQGRLFVKAEVRSDGGAGEKPSVLLTVPLAGALKSLAEDVLINERSLGFTLKSRGVDGRFVGEIDEAGTTFVGTLTLTAGGRPPDALPFSLVKSADAKSAANKTMWVGALDVNGTKLPFVVTLADVTDIGTVGAIDIPTQNLLDFPLLVTKREDGGYAIVVPIPGDATMELAPKVEDDGTAALVGTYSQGGLQLPLTLKPSDGSAPEGARRPQTPMPPFPYDARDVVIKHRFGHSLAGTLLIPERKDGTPEKFPAVVLISGSGPQDRDESVLGHKPFLVLADALARAGIAVMRYDDRGTGRSTGSFEGASSYDFATDCDEVTEWMRTQPDIDPRRIGLIGHSEGGMIAPVVAKWQWEDGDPSVAARFIVLIAGPGVSGAEVLALQMRRLMEAEGATPEEVDSVAVPQTAAIAAIVAKKPTAEIEAAVRTMVEAQIAFAAAHGAPQPPEALEAATKMGVEQLGSLWMREFLDHDPRGWISSLVIPVLAVNGTLDLQVDVDQNLPAIEAAAKAGNVPLTTMRFEKLNHLLQPATTGAVQEYSAIETTIDPAALAYIVDWVVKTANDPAILTLKPKAPPADAAPVDDKRPVAPVIPAMPAAPVPPAPETR